MFHVFWKYSLSVWNKSVQLVWNEIRLVLAMCRSHLVAISSTLSSVSFISGIMSFWMCCIVFQEWVTYNQQCWLKIMVCFHPIFWISQWICILGLLKYGNCIFKPHSQQGYMLMLLCVFLWGRELAMGELLLKERYWISTRLNVTETCLPLFNMVEQK
jgi:hypothetical protein